MNNEINLIWQTFSGDSTEFEFEYITEVLLKNINYKIYFDNGRFQNIKNNSIIIYSNNTPKISSKFILYLLKFIRKRYRFLLIHLSNECFTDNYWIYNLPDFVFRNYYDKRINNHNVKFIPLGFKSGFLNTSKIYYLGKDRKFEVAFIGQPKQDRNELISVLSKMNSSFIHTTSSWNCLNSLSVEECIKVYADTKFLPCPMGNIHHDSFRICESLEWGCIPVVKKYSGIDYFEAIFPNHPFIVVDNWSELPDLINKINYEDLSREVNTWYIKYKNDLQKNVTELVHNHLIRTQKKSSIRSLIYLHFYSIYKYFENRIFILLKLK